MSSSAETEEVATTKKKLPLPIIAAAVVLIVGATFFFGQKVGAGTGKTKTIIVKQKQLPGYRLQLEEMIVNLKNPERYIRVTPEVEFLEQPKVPGEEGAKEFEVYVSRIEGAITVVFRSTPADKLNSREGIREVEKRMVEEINEVIEEPEGQVQDIVLGKFATQ